MWAGSTIFGYIDPNTSQHVFSLLWPILAFLAATGGLAVAGFVVVRHRIASFFKKASWATRIAMASITVGALVIVSVIVCRLIW